MRRGYPASLGKGRHLQTGNKGDVQLMTSCVEHVLISRGVSAWSNQMQYILSM